MGNVVEWKRSLSLADDERKVFSSVGISKGPLE